MPPAHRAVCKLPCRGGQVQARASTRALGPTPSVPCTGRLSRHGHRRPVTGGPGALLSAAAPSPQRTGLSWTPTPLPSGGPCARPASPQLRGQSVIRPTLKEASLQPKSHLPPRRAVSIAGPWPRGSARGVPRTRTPGTEAERRRQQVVCPIPHPGREAARAGPAGGQSRSGRAAPPSLPRAKPPHLWSQPLPQGTR